MDLKSGSVLTSPSSEVYTITRFIGGGGFGCVVKARGCLDVDYAIKLIPINLAQGQEFSSDKMLQEISLFRQASWCAPEWVPRVRESFVTEIQRVSFVALVMDLIDGVSLERMVSQLPLPEQLVCYIVREILQALERLHSAMFIHRDIKGANLLVSSTGRVLLCDFGTTRKLEQGAASTLAGTPYWMAPEIARKHFQPNAGSYDHKADIWALGVTTVEIATGDPIITATEGLSGKGAGAIMFRIATCPLGAVPLWKTHRYGLSE
eukprot:Filipodium_phascolosomae@DN2089_c0_g1_i3.p2